jgi:hypothetical protein
MTGPAICELAGRWRMVEADLRDRGYLDLVEPAYLQGRTSPSSASTSKPLG